MEVGRSKIRTRGIRPSDAAALAEIEASHTHELRPDWWSNLVERHVSKTRASVRVGLIAEDQDSGQVVGYVLGQVRAFEFGSDPCGWIYSVGVRTSHLRQEVASQLLNGARAAFRDAGVKVVRTMVSKEDVPVLTFFRSSGFVAGPFVELELRLDTGSDDAGSDDAAPEGDDQRAKP